MHEGGLGLRLNDGSGLKLYSVGKCLMLIYSSEHHDSTGEFSLALTVNR